MSDLPVAAPDHAHWDTSAIEARIINGTTTKADVRWFVESVEALADHRDALLAERQQDKERIERLEDALDGLEEFVAPQHWRDIRAALAVEEDAE